LDLFCANGHVYPEVDGAIRETYRQPLQLFRNLGNGKFRDVAREALSLPPQAARGGAFADYNNDGRLGMAISRIEGKPLLLENRTAPGNWLRLKLVGTRCNRQAIGARVKITAAGATQYDSVRAGGSYLSTNDPRLHFGIGTAKQADVEVKWPGGETEKFTAVPANRQFAIRQR
jgi:hypothetical protein